MITIESLIQMFEKKDPFMSKCFICYCNTMFLAKIFLKVGKYLVDDKLDEIVDERHFRVS